MKMRYGTYEGFKTKIAEQLHGWSHDFGNDSIDGMHFYLGLELG